MAATGAMAVRDRGLRRSYGRGADEAVTVTRELRWWGCEVSALAGSRAPVGSGVPAWSKTPERAEVNLLC